ncbi:DUF1476 domain-containing protein [Pseudovibrio exalbescens]|uniref:DUF1476 domain-containing protein n=1 Tax=Pseudovibrio exalbescens TaxID=197461 RepID=UPI002366970F|nr:DUF1476 domain-containing protein [Pseudovibrio exalbescens]MDD7910483.1 DUF1476 domain-containing protein [Pseudovibrio exalbescens]
MTTFDNREKSFEHGFAIGSELAFKARARRNQMIGLWAGEKLGMDAAAADAYASELVALDLKPEADDVVFERIAEDFAKAGVAQSHHQIRRNMMQMQIEAERQVRESV